MIVQQESARQIIDTGKPSGLRVVAGANLLTHGHVSPLSVDHFVLNEAELTLLPCRVVSLSALIMTGRRTEELLRDILVQNLQLHLMHLQFMNQLLDFRGCHVRHVVTTMLQLLFCSAAKLVRVTMLKFAHRLLSSVK